MQTDYKIKTVVSLVHELGFTETEMQKLQSVLFGKNQVSSSPQETSPKKRGRPRKDKGMVLECRKITYNKDGSPRKPYTRRIKPQPVSESKAEKQEEIKRPVPEVEKLDFDFLYENPNNPKGLIRSSEFLQGLKIYGVVIPYRNKQNAFFAVSFQEERKKLGFAEALRKAQSLPKYHGYSWEVLDEVQRFSILSCGEKLREQLKKYHGDAFQGCYLLSPPIAGHLYNKVRYTVTIDS